MTLEGGGVATAEKFLEHFGEFDKDHFALKVAQSDVYVPEQVT